MLFKIFGNVTREERSWILYDFANSAYGLVIMAAIMPIYYKGYVATGIPETTATADWGFANSGAGLLVAITAPIMGTIADARQSKKLFLFIFLLFGVIFTAMFALAAPGMRFFTLIIYALSLICFAGGNVFYDALLVDVTTKSRMDKISSAGYAWGYIGGAIPYILCIILIWWGEKAGNQPPMLKISFIITALWWALFAIPVIKNTHQKYVYSAENNKSMFSALKTLIQTVKKIRQYRNIALFLVAYFLYIDGVDTIIRMAVPYCKDAGMDSVMLILTVLGLQILAFPFTLLYSYLAQRCGARRMLYCGIIIYIFIALLAYYLPSIEKMSIKLGLVIMLAFMIATSQGGIQALSRSFYGKIIPPDQAAEFFGFYNIFGKFATIFGPLLIAFSGRFLGHTKYGMLSLVFLFAAGGICLALVRPEDKKNFTDSKNNLIGLTK